MKQRPHHREVGSMHGRAGIVILGLVAVLLGGGAVTAVTIGMQRGAAGAAAANGEGILLNETKGQGGTLPQQYGLDLGAGGGAPQRAGDLPAVPAPLIRQ